MNGVPPPADLTKLKNILGSAKAVMNKVDNGNYETGNVNGDAFTQNTEGYVDETNVKTNTQAQTMGNATRQMKQPNKEAILNSKMPEEIKKAMLENPITQPTMGHTFNLDDVSDLINEKPMQTNNKNLNETIVNGDMITISKSGLRDMIKDVLIEYLSVDYSKNISESVIKKTINTLVKEGKIKTKRSK